ncbi:HAD family hydrolase [Seleniivibrio woodruffii]|uniref:Putative hydrolase of the HAD superfamily n=1 Tax=Seleniivibrio woodruffii TaxID=1078050 RepID=A0A4R1K6Y2_9BACT|nr:HAD family phosphatase [Seleniivibrio woodruffii]TCK59992.1 putative hydrolase of the HAD superfamily [Seleniivibrio woodruffii]TVZ35787.1 putative hydrolase of the HAD superfamily [Seleniivibrio woodruffii]
MIKVVFFDFGGVIADEGWEKGLTEIAGIHGFDPGKFFEDACDVLWSTGYMYGRADEDTFWRLFAERYEFKMTRDEMRRVIFDRFAIRPQVIELIKRVNEAGLRTAILSDQVNWLDEFNDMYGFFGLFEKVYNSYRLGIGKKHPEIFPMVCAEMGIEPAEALFVDDNEGHIGRAKACGLNTVLFKDAADGIREIETIISI